MSSLADIPSENKCKQIFYEVTHGGLTTCSCGQSIIWKTNRNYGWCKYCRRKIFPKSRTFFSSSNLSCSQIFQLIWCWQNRQSPGSTKNILGIGYPAVRRWYKALREHLLPNDLTKLCGIVEVDEAYFGKRRYGNQTIVIGAIERIPDPITKTKRLKLQIIPDTESETLEQFIETSIESGSLVVTDCHGGYNDIEWLGYSHETWNHSKGHYAGTNHIEQTWSAMKRYLRKLYGNIPTRNIQLILNEWEARHNQPELFISPQEYLRWVVRD